MILNSKKAITPSEVMLKNPMEFHLIKGFSSRTIGKLHHLIGD